MWRLLYDSLPAFLVKESDSLVSEFLDTDSLHTIEKLYAIKVNDKIVGVLYGNHVLNIKMKSFYSELIQRTIPIYNENEVLRLTINKILTRIIKQQNSIISPKEFQIIQSFSITTNEIQFTKNTYCIDCSDFTKLRLHHLCSSRKFKMIKDEYSKKWKSIIAMKNFQVTKLYYKKHLLIGFTLYRKDDGEKFFWSGQFQEVLESLI
ncbi:hypothetical protein [Maribacter spongiicola]|uniref:hypothetical protein n=1 Tax=Maribacter spongiicola TaxID=1206753 RepID=UPI003F99ED51